MAAQSRPREGEELRLQSSSLFQALSGVQVLVCGHLDLSDSSFPG